MLIHCDILQGLLKRFSKKRPRDPKIGPLRLRPHQSDLLVRRTFWSYLVLRGGSHQADFLVRWEPQYMRICQYFYIEVHILKVMCNHILKFITYRNNSRLVLACIKAGLATLYPAGLIQPKTNFIRPARANIILNFHTSQFYHPRGLVTTQSTTTIL